MSQPASRQVGAMRVWDAKAQSYEAVDTLLQVAPCPIRLSHHSSRSVDSTVLRGLVHGDVETFWVRFGGCLGGRLGLERTNERTQTTPEQPPHSGRRRARGRDVWGLFWGRLGSFVRPF